MTPLELFANPVAAYLVDLVIKATVLLVLSIGLVAIFRKSSAAVRHRIWSLTFAGLLLLPAFSYVMPELQLPILPAEMVQVSADDVSVAEIPDVEASTPASPNPQPEHSLADRSTEPLQPFSEGVPNDLPPWERDSAIAPPLEGQPLEIPPEMDEKGVVSEMADAENSGRQIEPDEFIASTGAPEENTASLWLWVWGGGLSIFLLPVLIGLLQNRVLDGLSRRVADSSTLELLDALRARLSIDRGVRLVESDHSRIPLTWGLFSPVVLFPSDWRDWTTERKRLVLLHELAHVKRWDVAFQLLARMACAIYWFHPLSWLALRRLKNESELACDDCVLLTGESPQAYASELVDIARSVRRAIYPAAVAMAQTSSLEQRIRALLDRARSRLPLGGRLAGILCVAGLLIVAGIAAITPVVSEVAAETEFPIEKEAPEVAVVEMTSDEVAASVTEAQDKATEPADEMQIVRGRVLDPDGNPLAGATVRSAMPMYAMLEPLLPPETQLPMSETKSDAVGRFEISFSRYPVGDLSMYDQRWRNIWTKTEIAASHPDYGPAWVSYEEIADDDEFTLKLVPDVPLRGRIVDLEGRPVPNVEVSFTDYGSISDGNLDAWLEGVKLGQLPWTVVKHMPLSMEPRLIGIPETYRTDPQGRFEIRGVGRDRVVQCNYQGETAAYEKFRAAARELEPLEKLINTPLNQATETVYGKDFTIVATLSRPVEGIVKDAETGQSLAGVNVHSYRFTGYPYANHRVLKTKTDENGRFRLTGFPKGDGNRLLVLPNDEQPYFMREVDLPNPTGAEPVEVEIELHRGIWITGRVTDKETGRPQHARLYYFPFRDNSYAQVLPEFDSNGNADGDQMRYQTRSDGTFRLVGLPGRAIVGAWSVLKQYRTGVGAEQIEGIQENGTFSTFSVANNPGRLWPSNLVEIDPPADAESIEVSFELEFGGSVPVEIVDPDGLPVDGRKLRVDGHLNRGSWAEVDTAQFEVANLQRDETRTVVFHDEERHLGWVEQIKYDENRQRPLTIRLQSDATIIGRLVDGEGDAIAGVSLRLDPYPGGDYSISLSGFTTGREGHFTIRIPAGADYHILAEGVRNVSYKEIAEKLQVEPGETIDLGEIDITSKERPEPKRTPAKMSPSSTVSQSEATQIEARPQETVCAGQVVDGQGRPVNGAYVAVIARSQRPREGGDVFAGGEILSEGTSDSEGRFELTLEGVSGQTHHTPMVIARKDGAAMAWSDWGQIDLNASLNETTLQLRPEEPIRGRLIDINGQPAAGARLLVWTLTKPTGDPSFPTNVAVFTVDIGSDVPAAWIPKMTTDEQGRFIVHGVPAGFGATINVGAGEQFAPQRIALNTGRPEQHDEEYDLYHWLVKNVEPGEEAVLALAPAQQFEGVVRFEDTREPAANARMTIWASQRQRATSTVWVAGQADAEGRYRITPNPGVAFGFIAYSPDGTPYLGRQTPSTDPIRWKSAGQKMQVDVDLPRGVLVKGRVLEAGTGTPVAGVAVQYVPESDNNDNASDEVVTGPGSVRLSGDDGRFEIAVLPGPGRLLARSPDAKYVLQTIGSRELSSGLPGGERRYAHAVSKIDPVADSEPFDVTLELQPGKSISGRIVNERGEPVDRTTLVTRLVVVPSTAFLVWSGDDSFTTRGGRFELTGLADGEEYPVYVLDPENRLGATATLSTKNPSPTIVLEPCGSAVARFVHPDGNPVAGGLQFDLHMVVTPGTTRFDRAAIRNGELVADEQPVSKFDPVNYTAMPKTDEDGKITYPALIPGARYRFINYVDGNPQISGSFIAKSGETYDMGAIVVERSE